MASLQNLTVVLERPLNSGNIGSVARAMKNMGLRRLLLVDPAASHTCQDAVKMAMGARDILEKARLFPTLRKALDGFQLVVGTTRRKGRIRRPLLTPRELAPKVLEMLPKNKVALVFGNEKDGLSNEDLFQCHWISIIPTAPEQPSLNLAQAVMIYCYEIFLAAEKKNIEGNGNRFTKLADQQTREKMFDLIDATLLRIGFYEHGSPVKLMRSVRQLLGKANLSEREIRILRGIFGQMQRVLDVGLAGDLP